MVKIKYILLTSFVLILSACMGEKGDVWTYGSQAGVVKEEAGKQILTYSGQKITSDALQEMPVKKGDCCLVDYKINFSSSQNKDADIYQVDILDYKPVSKWILQNVPDTVEFRMNESLWNLQTDRSLYLDSCLFIFPKYNVHYQSQTDQFTVSYSPEQELQKDMSTGLRYLDLYIRSTNTIEPNDSVVTSGYILPQAFYIKDFVDNARNKGYISGDSLNVRLVYPTGIDMNEMKYRWNSTGIYTILLDRQPENLQKAAKMLHL